MNKASHNSVFAAEKLPPLKKKKPQTLITIVELAGVAGIMALAFLSKDTQAPSWNFRPSVEVSKFMTEPDLERSTGIISRQQYLEAFVWVARAKLEYLSIHHALTVKPAGANSLEITGQLSDNLTGRYDLFKSWFAGQDNFPDILDKVEEVKITGAIPGIKSVWLSETVTAFFDDGSSGQAGDRMENGWEIVKIDQAQIVLQKNSIVVSMEY